MKDFLEKMIGEAFLDETHQQTIVVISFLGHFQNILENEGLLMSRQIATDVT